MDTKKLNLLEFENKTLKEIISITKEKINANMGWKEEDKTISIDKLPDCQHKARLSNMVTNSAEAKICVVAILNKDGTWQAYAGYPDVRDLKPIMQDYTFDIPWFCEFIRDRQQVIMMGEKLDKDTACILFPEWDESKHKGKQHE